MFKTHLDKDCIILSIFRLAAVSGRRIFPIQIQSVEVVLPQEPDRAADEGLPAGGVGHERAEPAGTFVPSSDGQEGLQVAVVGLQCGELAVTTFETSHTKFKEIERNFNRVRI